MKKLLLAFSLLSLIGSASAHGPYRMGGWHGGYYGGGCGGCWIAPAVIGGVVGYELTRPTTVVVEQPSVVYTQPQPVVTQPIAQTLVADPDYQVIQDPYSGAQQVYKYHQLDITGKKC